jgi:hypothetical protein
VIGVISEPPPTPVNPTRSPTMKPDGQKERVTTMVTEVEKQRVLPLAEN